MEISLESVDVRDKLLVVRVHGYPTRGQLEETRNILQERLAGAGCIAIVMTTAGHPIDFEIWTQEDLAKIGLYRTQDEQFKRKLLGKE